jgi:hypothetical protein
MSVILVLLPETVFSRIPSIVVKIAILVFFFINMFGHLLARHKLVHQDYNITAEFRLLKSIIPMMEHLSTNKWRKIVSRCYFFFLIPYIVQPDFWVFLAIYSVIAVALLYPIIRLSLAYKSLKTNVILHPGFILASYVSSVLLGLFTYQFSILLSFVCTLSGEIYQYYTDNKLAMYFCDLKDNREE